MKSANPRSRLDTLRSETIAEYKGIWVIRLLLIEYLKLVFKTILTVYENRHLLS